MEILLSIKDTAEVFGCSSATINRQIKDGTITPPVRIGHRVTFPRSEIKALLTARIAGADTQTIRNLVNKLTAKRKEA